MPGQHSGFRPRALRARLTPMSTATLAHDAGDAPAHGWRSSFLPAQWLKGYRRAWLRHDAVTGITLAAYAIPVFLAYASLAGLPPQHGVYCYLVAGVAYALFGTSRQLAIGPTLALSLLVGTMLAAMAAGDPARALQLAALAASGVAGICFIAWALKLSVLVSFISEQFSWVSRRAPQSPSP